MIHRFRCLLLCLLAATTAGCGAVRTVNSLSRDTDPSVELLQAELRWMEDNLYRMDDQLDRSLTQLQSTQRDNAVLRLELAEARRDCNGAGPAAGYRDSTPASNGQGDRSGNPSDLLRPTRASMPKTPGDQSADDSDFDQPSDEDLYDLDNLSPPDVRLGPSEESEAIKTPTPQVDLRQTPTEADPRNNPLNVGDDVQVEGLPVLPPKSVLPKDKSNLQDPFRSDDPFDSDEEARTQSTLQQVARIVLNRQLTGGYNFDKQVGHDGIMVVIEPQNSYAQYLPLSGDITVEARDPLKPGIAGRVGKWKFNPSEAADHLKQSMLGKGFHLELPWPNSPPQSEHLLLKVTYLNSTGRELQAERMIRIEPTVPALAAKATEAERSRWSPNRSSATIQR